MVERVDAVYSVAGVSFPNAVVVAGENGVVGRRDVGRACLFVAVVFGFEEGQAVCSRRGELPLTCDPPVGK
jgi:hypothetical protein